MIGDNLEIYTFDYLIETALSEVPDSLDKRQGSVIYDALAPACARLAELFMVMRNVYVDTNAATATDEALDKRTAEQGITRYSATYALKRADFLDATGKPMQVTVGARLSTISDIEPIIYYVESPYSENGQIISGAYSLRCETAGTKGNEYSGTMASITYIRGLASVTMTDIIIPARDEETDEELRARYFDTINNKPYGGNIAQYNQEVRAIPGVGDVQIYPVWNGGGTVKLSIVDTEYNPCSTSFLQTLQNKIDPAELSGQGIGIAPIGHSVTVVTPVEVEINVALTIVIQPGYSLFQLTPLIQEAISNYFVEVKKSWGVETPLGTYTATIYLARIMMAALNVTGVLNVPSVTINGVAQDLILTESSTLQQLPKLKGVVVNA